MNGEFGGKGGGQSVCPFLHKISNKAKDPQKANYLLVDNDGY